MQPKRSLPIKQPKFIFILMISSSITCCVILGSYFSPHDPYKAELSQRLCPMSREHPLGCDLYGSDVLSQVFVGAKTSLYIASMTVFFTFLLGGFLGLLGGFFGRGVDRLLMILSEIFMAFPGILLAMSFAALMGTSINTLILALTLTGWTAPLRIVRAQVLKVKQFDYVLAARALGAMKSSIIYKHILPSIWPPVIVSAAFSFAGVIIVEASLSFLGFGIENAISWGSLLNQGRSVLHEAPSLSLIPGALIFITVLTFNFAGDMLQNYLNPRLANEMAPVSIKSEARKKN